MSTKVFMAGNSRNLPKFISSSINQSAGSTNLVTAPTGIQNGDLLVAVGYSRVPAVTVTPPSGFNVINTSSGSLQTLFVATKTASSETGDYTFTWSATAEKVVAVLVYRNASRVNTVGALGTTITATGTAPSITPSYRGVLAAVFGIQGSKAVNTAPSGMTQRAVQTASRPNFVVYDQSPQEASVTGDKSLVWGGADDTASFLFQVTNEPAVAPEFVASASTQNASSGTTLVINKPTGTVAGDLMVAVMASADAAASSWTGDAGWSEVADLATGPNLRIAYKTAGAAEGGSYTFTVNNGNVLSGCILTYRYAAYDTIGSFAVDADPLILPTISPSASQSILFAAGANKDANVTLGTPAGMTARITDNNANQPSYIVCSRTVARGPAGTSSMSSGNTLRVAGIMFSIKPTRSF